MCERENKAAETGVVQTETELDEVSSSCTEGVPELNSWGEDGNIAKTGT